MDDRAPPCIMGFQHLFGRFRGPYICDYCQVEVPEKYREGMYPKKVVKPTRGFKKIGWWQKLFGFRK